MCKIFLVVSLLSILHKMCQSIEQAQNGGVIKIELVHAPKDACLHPQGNISEAGMVVPVEACMPCLH